MNPQHKLIAQQFSAGQDILDIAPLGNGLINDTYLILTQSDKFVLQRINTSVFPNYPLLLANFLKISQHLASFPIHQTALELPTLILSNAGELFFQDCQQQIWRAMTWIAKSESREHLTYISEASQVGFALAHFHQLFSSLNCSSLYDTLPGFHITPRYYSDYQAALNQFEYHSDQAEVEFCQQFIADYEPQISLLEQAKHAKKLTERVIHGDPKLNNFLFQTDSDRIISLIDLDTVKPGLIHYDIGDCLRSCCHIKHDDQFNLEYAKAILEAYLQEARLFFSAADYEYLYICIELIPFELGLRFFTDYLQGNLYFKVIDPEQNLFRALTQFKLCQNIQNIRTQLESEIYQLREKFYI